MLMSFTPICWPELLPCSFYLLLPAEYLLSGGADSCLRTHWRLRPSQQRCLNLGQAFEGWLRLAVHLTSK